MAEWTNIFELGEWEVYVQYYGATSNPTPDSRGHLVKASELDSRVGTVKVENGLIVCDFENPGSLANPQPTVLVMPVGEIASASARLTCSGVDSLDSGASSAFCSCSGVTDEGDGAYSGALSEENIVFYTNANEWLVATELPSALPSTNGLAFIRYGKNA